MQHQRILLTACVLATALSANAMWMRPEEVPVARVIRNLDAKLAKDPNDLEARLSLARVHSYAFAEEADRIGVYSDNPPEYVSVQFHREKAPSQSALLHLRKAIVNYDILLSTKRENGLGWLGMGSVLEEFARFGNGPLKLTYGTLKTKADVKLRALDAYRKCFQIGLTSDFAVDKTVFHGVEKHWLTREAGQNIFRMVEKEKVTTFGQGEKAKIEDAIERSKERPAAITPLLFPVNEATPLKSLIKNNARARFDIAGDGIAREWPWITPAAAWLVWDPQSTGQVTSGRQLFGGATWWMMPKNGFEALSMLDNDGNGWVSRGELTGVAVWHDRNSNAVSDPGEVVPATKFGIAALRTSFDRRGAVSLDSTRGVLMRDGRVLPVYDWVPVGRPVAVRWK